MKKGHVFWVSDLLLFSEKNVPKQWTIYSNPFWWYYFLLKFYVIQILICLSDRYYIWLRITIFMMYTMNALPTLTHAITHDVVCLERVSRPCLPEPEDIEWLIHLCKEKFLWFYFYYFFLFKLLQRRKKDFINSNTWKPSRSAGINWNIDGK